MRPQQNNFNNHKRGRGRNRGNGGGGGNKPQNILHRNFESNGPDVKVRGTAQTVYEKYLQLARDANSAGDRVMAESYLQHAEHYYRIIAAAQASMPQPQPQQGQQGAAGQGHQNGGRNGYDAEQADGEGDETEAEAVVVQTNQPVAPAIEDEQPVV